MGITRRYSGRVLAALLLTAVLTGSLLIKPAHILFVHHERSEIVHAEFPQNTVSPFHARDCSICDFEFCSFIPQKQVIVPQVTMFSLNELASRTVACFVCNSSHNFQLRAPPACWILFYSIKIACKLPKAIIKLLSIRFHCWTHHTILPDSGYEIIVWSGIVYSQVYIFAFYIFPVIISRCIKFFKCL